jgi:phosphatidylglycerophosphatase A
VRSLALAVATFGGVGYAPAAPGTIASLVALPALPLLAGLRARAPSLAVALVVLTVAVAIWAAGAAERVVGGHDASCIVIDEVAGLAVAGLLVPATWPAAGLAFLLFRLFDVVKPFPAGAVDRRVPGGIGVVGDDLVAGAYAGLAARGLLGLL